jgi:hypothetical protein
MSLKTRNWAAAAKVIHNWEASGKIGEEPPDIPTIGKAVEKYLADAEGASPGPRNGAQAARAPGREAAAVL